VYGGCKTFPGSRLSSPVAEPGGIYNVAQDSWTSITREDAPVARCHHAAVWTGTHMIVWGGEEYRAGKTGGIYDPAQNQWASIDESESAPASRRLPHLFWAKDKLLVWGGSDSNSWSRNCFVDGAYYDPGAKSWTPLSTQGAPPSNRCTRGVAWTGQKLVVFGGYHGSDKLFDGAVFNAETNEWKALSATLAPNLVPYQALYIDQQVLFVGEVVGRSGKIALFLFDPETLTWTQGSTINAPVLRGGFAHAWTGTSWIFWGGYEGGNRSYFQDGGIFTP